MAAPSDPLRKAVAIARIAIGVLFVAFGQYKVFSPAFIHNGLRHSVENFIQQNQAVGFYKVFLVRVVLPHADAFGYIVGLGELAIGLALILGFWVRPASFFGALHMLSLVLATFYVPGRDAPLWRYLAAQLEHVPLFFLFLIFLVAGGEVWGIDGLRVGRPKRVQ